MVRKLKPSMCLYLIKGEQPLFMIMYRLDWFCCHSRGEYRRTVKVSQMATDQKEIAKVHVYGLICYHIGFYKIVKFQWVHNLVSDDIQCCILWICIKFIYLHFLQSSKWNEYFWHLCQLFQFVMFNHWVLAFIIC